MKEKLIAKGKTALTYYYHRKFQQEYEDILARAYTENPQPATSEKKRGRKKNGKVLSLIKRLDTHKEAVCLFIKNFSVPFDNNQAERDVRMVKVKTKVSGCFRSIEGAEDYLKIMSYVGTAKKKGFNPFEAIKKAIIGNPEFIFG